MNILDSGNHNFGKLETDIPDVVYGEKGIWASGWPPENALLYE